MTDDAVNTAARTLTGTPDLLLRALAGARDRVGRLESFAGPAISTPIDRDLDTVHRHTIDIVDELGETRTNYERACQTIALMHAPAREILAGDGVAGGPLRGVVEDVQDLANRCRAAEEALDNYQAGELDLANRGADRAAIEGLYEEIGHLHATMRRWAGRRFVHSDTVTKAISRAAQAGATARKQASS